MACYISSNDNRFYAAIESEYGTAASLTEQNRVPAVAMRMHQETESPRRQDKTGGRTFMGLPNGFRKHTTFELATLMVGWTEGSEPPYGALFQAALGGQPLTWAGAQIQSVPEDTQLVFSGSHNLAADQAVTYEGEIRFVSSVVNPQTVLINAPFAARPAAGAQLGPTITYMPANTLPSLTVVDYWDPSDSIQRMVTGAGVDRMRLSINGDFHQFQFSGPGRDMVDSVSFSAGQAGLTAFPEEPPLAAWSYSLVPGNLGQVWFGAVPQQFFSVLEAQITLDNNIDLRNREFGSTGPRCMAPGLRSVSALFSLYANTRAETVELFQASRQRSPISMMLQLGQSSGHLCGALLKAVVPEAPHFDDDESRLRWRFDDCRAQGSSNDELVIAFG